MSRNYDVIIIGGGIVGSCIAAHLATENLRTAVINSTTLGTPASIAAAGLFQLQIGELKNPLIKDYCYKSYDYFLSFYEKIKSSLNLKDIDLGFKRVGSLYLIFSILEISQKENELKELKKIEPNISFLNKQEIPKQEPLLTKEILGAYHYPNEGFINNPKFLKAIFLYCIERKIEVINSEVTEIIYKNNMIEKIILSNGEYLEAKKYVLCNGVWANKFLRKLLNTSENIIKSIKGEILEVAVPQEFPIKKVIFCHDGYILPRPPTNSLEKSSILIGSTTEEINLETTKDPFKNTISGVSYLTNLFQKLLPTCKNYPIINMWSGLRPTTKDNLPILGKIQEIDNLYLSGGHYRTGILMGPFTGKILSNLILENTSDFNIEPFKIDRLIKQRSLISNQPSARR